MKDKITKAYWTAWRWPEVYTDSKSLIWISRSISFAIPLLVILLVFITILPVAGLLLSCIIAGAVGIALGAFMISLFYGEHTEVEDYDARQARIKEFFHGFPAITDVALIESERNDWIAYGHVDPKLFIASIQAVVWKVTEDPVVTDSFLGKEESVGHLYAVFHNPKEGHWDEGLEFCKPSKEDCFPITRLQL